MYNTATYYVTCAVIYSRCQQFPLRIYGYILTADAIVLNRSIIAKADDDICSSNCTHHKSDMCMKVLQKINIFSIRCLIIAP